VITLLNFYLMLGAIAAAAGIVTKVYLAVKR